MLRHLPKFKYNGLTVILSNPSRFDKDNDELLSATGGWYFNNECLSPHTNRYCCDIRLCDDPSPLIRETKCVLVLGQYALSKLIAPLGNLEDLRGSPLTYQGIPCIATFLPQDAMDPKNFEKSYNAKAHDSGEAELDSTKEYLNAKARSRTARSNYRFWLRQDVLKALHILNHGVPTSQYTPVYHIYPTCAEVLSLLYNTTGKDFYFDIETDIDTMDMRCFAFSFGANAANEVHVYVVPTLDINYRPAYAEISKILLGLYKAFSANTVVAHNGHCFDFLLLAFKYHCPIGRSVYDTLIAQQRIYPTVELSLGHCVSLWTWEPFHKGEGEHTYRTTAQAEMLYKYCGKDVYTMFLVKKAQLDFAKTIPGMEASIAQAMASIRPYLITTLLGMKYDEAMRQEWVKTNDRWMQVYLKIMQVLIGDRTAPLISNKKCVEYFHKQLDYPVISRSGKTNEPSLAKDILYKLKLSHDNPVIDLLIAYRERQRETGVLNFEPWIKNTQPAESSLNC